MKYRGAVHSICNLTYVCLLEFLQFFIMGQTMIIILALKEFAEELKRKQFTCL